MRLVVNTLAVFAMAATVGIGTILGVLILLCWVEKRLLDGRAARGQSHPRRVRHEPSVGDVSGSAAVPERSDSRAPVLPSTGYVRAAGVRQGRVAVISGVLAVVALACVASQRHGRATMRAVGRVGVLGSALSRHLR